MKAQKSWKGTYEELLHAKVLSLIKLFSVRLAILFPEHCCCCRYYEGRSKREEREEKKASNIFFPLYFEIRLMNFTSSNRPLYRIELKCWKVIEVNEMNWQVPRNIDLSKMLKQVKTKQTFEKVRPGLRENRHRRKRAFLFLSRFLMGTCEDRRRRRRRRRRWRRRCRCQLHLF